MEDELEERELEDALNEYSHPTFRLETLEIQEFILSFAQGHLQLSIDQPIKRLSPRPNGSLRLNHFRKGSLNSFFPNLYLFEMAPRDYKGMENSDLFPPFILPNIPPNGATPREVTPPLPLFRGDRYSLASDKIRHFRNRRT